MDRSIPNFRYRGLEFHNDRMWKWGSVARALDFMEKYDMKVTEVEYIVQWAEDHRSYEQKYKEQMCFHMCELFGVKEGYFYEEPSSLAEEEAAAAVSEAAEPSLHAEQVVAQELPGISPRKRAAFWLMFGLLAFLVVAVSVVLMLAYFPYEQVGDVYTTVVVWNFSYGCIVGMIAAGMLLCLVLLALLAWRFIKKYGFKAKKIQECQAKLDTCQAKLGGQNADDKVQSEEKTR